MNSYAIGPYLKCLCGKINGYLQSGSSGVYVLDAIALLDNVRVTVEEKNISALVNRNENLNGNIVAGAKNPANRESIYNYFDKKIVPKIVSIQLTEACYNILQAIKKDTTIPERNYDVFNKLYEEEKYTDFLVEALIYACSRTNKAETEIQEDEIPLLSEVEYACPICGKPLITDVRGTSKRNYEIVSIYDESYELPPNVEHPKNLNTNKNRIALCKNHYDEYFDNVDETRYKAMLELKEKVESQKKARDVVSGIKLQRQIIEVIDALKEDNDFTDFEFESKNVTEIKKNNRSVSRI